MLDRPSGVTTRAATRVTTRVTHAGRGAAGLVGWFAVLVATIVVFTVLGRGALAAPDLLAPSTWSDWAAGRDTPTAVVAMLRVVVLALAWYLLVATIAAVSAHLTRRARLVRVADAFAVPVVRRLVRAGLGAGLAASVATSTAGPVLLHPPTVLVAAEDDDAPTRTPHADAPTMTPLDPEPGPEPTMPRVVPPGMSRPDAPPPTPHASTAVDAVATEDATPDPAPTPGEHVVVSGDHLWSIAEQALASHLGRSPSDAEVVPYWRRVIAGNRDRLADPDNPDLIFPGQRIALPEVDE